jgi:hypothetical protein
VITASGGKSVKKALSEVSRLLGREPDESVLILSGSKMEKIRRSFGISELEIEATMDRDIERTVVNLIIERMALLSTMI